MDQPIVGFHRDDEGHWVAELACGHDQHVRHDPPWTSRPWVTTPAGRNEALGRVLGCRKCDRSAPRDRPDTFPAITSHRASMSRVARGSFTVELLPLAMEGQPEGTKLGRRSIDKTIEGDLLATSAGQMLSAMTDVAGSAGYVAIERVDGTLHGRSGTFVLQHTGTMDRGTPSLTVTVVPDSGTGELTGLSGRFTIVVAGSEHRYEFEYSLPG